jgi:hypothetical protein
MRRACCLPLILIEPRYTWGHNDIESETALISSLLPTFLRGVEGLSYENFLSEASFPIIRTRSNANGTEALLFLFLFLSAFGFFFSRLLLNWPFATLSSFACGEYSILDRPHTAAVHVERSSGAVHDLLRDHDLLDALEAG